MTDDMKHDDLTALFAAQDRELEAAPFVETVMTRVESDGRKRRLVLAGAALFGGILAGSQIPKLLSEMTGVEFSLTQALTLAQDQVQAEVMTAPPLWIAAAVVASLSMLAAMQLERA